MKLVSFLPFTKPALILLCCAFFPGRVSANGPEPLPDFNCVIEPSEIIDLGSAVPGLIDKVYAKRSDSIKKGEVVASLDSSVANANAVLSKARAEMTTSISLRKESAAFGSRTSERNHVLFNKAAISAQDIDKLDTENRIAQLQVLQERDNKKIAALTYDRAKAVLDRHLIRSPIDGVVMEGFRSVGEYIEDDPVMRIAQIDPLHVEVILPVKYIGRLAPGRRAKITPDVPGYLPQVATVTRVDKVADAASGTFGARLILPNSDHAIAGGLRCNLSFLSVEDALPEPPPQVVPSENSYRAETPDEVRASRACYRVGPMTNETVAASLSNAISTLDPANQPQYDKKIGYQVFITFQQDQKLLTDLEGYLLEKGIEDFYLLSPREGQVRIAVGFYDNEIYAIESQQIFAELGIEAKIAKVIGKSYWVNLSLSSSESSMLKLESLVKNIAPAASVKLTQCGQ